MIRQTRQRAAIERALREAGRPLSPSEIHVLAKRILPHIGLRTVYRQITDMVAEQQLVGIDYPGQPLRYELTHGEHHPHFICRKCNRVFDLRMDAPEVKVTAPQGFVIDGQETIFYGYCPGCRKESKT